MRSLLNLKSKIGQVVRRILRLSGYTIIRCNTDTGLGYIDAEKTVTAARQKGLSVAEYVALIWNEQGCVDLLVDFLSGLPVIWPYQPSIVEIGPGTGRFLEPIYKKFNPLRYEIYETSSGWRKYLSNRFAVKAQPASGSDLASTADRSCDLVHAHFVFVYLPIITSFSYFSEMCRILKPGGYAVFDAYFDEECTVATIEEWSKFTNTFQMVLPKKTVVEFFAKHGCVKLDAEFNLKVFRGQSRYLVFQKS